MKFSHFPIAAKLYSEFGLVVSVRVILGVLFYSFFTSVTEANQWNIHTWRIIDETRGLTQSLVNMETGLRGYAL